jgi:hypothetical protein
MSEQIRGFQGRIIKWDGDPPLEAEAYQNPEAHPKCAEVVEFSDGKSPVVTYKREELNHGTD